MPGKLLILGCGSIACLFAARIYRAGIPVFIWDTWLEGLMAIRENGVQLEEDGLVRGYKVPVLESVNTGEKFTHALILTKSYQTSDTVRLVQNFLSSESTLLTLQNGLTARGKIESILGFERVLGGVTTCAAQSLGPGYVKYQGGNSIRVGEHPAAKRYLSLLQHAGFETIIEQEIEVMTWEKALMNAAINPLGAITGLTNGGLLKDQGIRETMCSIMDEGCQVAKECGLEINSEKLFAKALNVLEETAPNRCSMLQDVDGGRQTEIEDINGVILQLAEKYLVDVPIMQTITNLIKAIERK